MIHLPQRAGIKGMSHYHLTRGVLELKAWATIPILSQSCQGKEGQLAEWSLQTSPGDDGVLAVLGITLAGQGSDLRP